MATKNKTNKSVKKRIKVTGSGTKLKHGKVGRRHLNAHMAGNRKRQLRQAGVIEGRPSVLKKYKIALGEL
jgi:large subunit ribosomal protein L35